MQFLQNIFAAPLDLILGPKHFIEDMWLESGRSRALLLGFPAFVVSLIGALVIGMAQFAKNDMEAGYVAVLERVVEDKERLEIQLQDEGRMAEFASVDAASDEDVDPRTQALAELREEESIYLQKLISMNPKEPAYRFRLAMSKLRTDPEHGISILKNLAPEDEAGFADAHKFLAKYYASLRPSTQTDAVANADLALTHADFSLKRDKNDNVSKSIKAQLLMKQDRLKEANELFSELFEEEPQFYRQLLQINERLERTDLDESIVERALISYNERLSRGDLNDRKWVATWLQMIDCYRELGDFERAAELLTDEIGKLANAAGAEQQQESADKARSRRVFLRKLLSGVYLNWAGKIASADGATKEDKLNCLQLATQAYRLNQNDSNVLRLIARLATDRDEEVANAAKAIYDPYEHFAAPSLVLNELGASAMQKGDYDGAVKFFELARKKDPNNPMILNNLSYSWLRNNDQDANRALQLVNQGLRLIAGSSQWTKFRPNFLDTKGTALVKLGRYEEAIAAFENALTARPNDVGLLQQLVECYENAGLDTEVLINRIERVEALNAESN
jgi:tetratricopeptide (TPR) repeat protein